jgi:drug/metabolite transporter (DMT)-like permease
MTSYRFSIALVIIQQFLFTIDTMAIHHLGGAIAVTEIGFLRSIGGIALGLCFALPVGWRVFYTHHPYLQLTRALLTVGYTWVLIFSFALIPLADATAISYVSGLYVVLLSGPLLGEMVSGRRYSAVLFGIVGAILIIKPGMSSASWVYLALMAGNALNAMAVILTKYLRREDKATTILLYVSVAQAMAFGVGSIEPWHIDESLWPWIVAILVTGPLGMFCGIIALNHADASVLAPYTYVRLIIATLGAALVFNEQLDLLAIAGSWIIIFACWQATDTVPTITARANGSVAGRDGQAAV